MWGAVIGDIAGSRFEGSRGGPKNFEFFHQHCRYTDDTVCTAAVADIIVNDHRPDSTLQAWCRRHPGRGYGGNFREWIASTAPTPYGSFGNGAAMRVAPVAFLYRGRSLEEALATSDRVTEITHDHPEGIKGARAVTEAIWLALQGEGPETLRREITTRYGYDLGQSLEAIRPSHRFDVTCQATVPTALICALESTSLEDAARNAVSLGGDTDTLAAIAGAVGEALHGLPERLVRIARAHYLEHAEDITAALDALYRHAKGDATASRPATVPEEVRGRAQGCLLGQLAGDSLGSLVEFKDASTIRTLYPDGVRELADGGVWNTLAGQPTDDSEMALALGRSLIRNGAFSHNDIRAAYVRWYESEPFDIGNATRCGLTGRPMTESQGNGALMRISPLGIFGWKSKPEELAKLAAADAALTHPNRICQQVNGLYAAAIAAAVREGDGPQTLYERIVGWAIEWNVDHEIAERIKLAQTHRPPEYNRQMGWVLTAFQNALYELLHAQKLEEGVIATVHCGGDTDTNAAICGALLGAVYGRSAVPQQWVDSLVTCRPGAQNASRPRPTEYWPHDALGLAERLVEAGATREAR